MELKDANRVPTRGFNRYVPSDPLSLWERAGVRAPGANGWSGTAGNGYGMEWEGAGLLGRPHPAFGHPLPEGEGLDLGRNEATLSQRERG